MINGLDVFGFYLVGLVLLSASAFVESMSKPMPLTNGSILLICLAWPIVAVAALGLAVGRYARTLR